MTSASSSCALPVYMYTFKISSLLSFFFLQIFVLIRSPISLSTFCLDPRLYISIMLCTTVIL